MSQPGRDRLYVARAKESIRSVLDDELAVIYAELEARISERSFSGERDNIDPHHVTTALRELTRAGLVVTEKAPTRGGHDTIREAGLSHPHDLTTITQPTLVANGDNDTMVASSQSRVLAERIPNAELIIYPDSEHGGIFQYHQRFVPAILKFLAS